MDWENFSAEITDTEWKVTNDVNGTNEQLKKCMNEAEKGRMCKDN